MSRGPPSCREGLDKPPKPKAASKASSHIAADEEPTLQASSSTSQAVKPKSISKGKKGAQATLSPHLTVSKPVERPRPKRLPSSIKVRSKILSIDSSDDSDKEEALPTAEQLAARSRFRSSLHGPLLSARSSSSSFLLLFGVLILWSPTPGFQSPQPPKASTSKARPQQTRTQEQAAEPAVESAIDQSDDEIDQLAGASDEDEDVDQLDDDDPDPPGSLTLADPSSTVESSSPADPLSLVSNSRKRLRSPDVISTGTLGASKRSKGPDDEAVRPPLFGPASDQRAASPDGDVAMDDEMSRQMYEAVSDQHDGEIGGSANMGNKGIGDDDEEDFFRWIEENVVVVT